MTKVEREDLALMLREISLVEVEDLSELVRDVCKVVEELTSLAEEWEWSGKEAEREWVGWYEHEGNVW